MLLEYKLADVTVDPVGRALPLRVKYTMIDAPAA